MAKIDEELIKGCQRYLDELEKRKQIVARHQEEQSIDEERKARRREYWREMFYGEKGSAMAFIVPEEEDV